MERDSGHLDRCAHPFEMHEAGKARRAILVAGAME
jgi:hypothetical protein